MASRRVLFCGASVRELVQFAKQDGWDPIAIDLFADRDTQAVGPAYRVASFNAIPPLARNLVFDHWILGGGMENAPEIVEKLGPGRMAGCDEQAIRASRDPFQLQQALQDCAAHLPRLARQPGEFPHGVAVLEKPLSSAGGKNVRLVGRHRQSPSNSTHGVYFSQFIPGQVASAIFFSEFRPKPTPQTAWLIFVSEQLVGPAFGACSPFGYCGNVGPTPLSPATRRQLLNIGNALASQWQLSGFFGLDFILTPGHSLFPLELNPRIPASMGVFRQIQPLNTTALQLGREAFPHSKKQELDVSDDVNGDVNGDVSDDADGDGNGDLDWAYTGFAGKLILYNRNADLAIPISEEFSNWAWERTRQPAVGGQGSSGKSTPPFWLGDIPLEGEWVPPRQPILTIHSNGESNQQVRSNLQQAAAAVRRQLDRMPPGR